MLPKEFRLKHKRDFDTLWKEGKFVNGTLTTLKYWKVDPARFPRRAYALGNLKIGFVVGLKISKKAVVRNRLKRQMREVVRLLLKDDLIKKGFLIALVAKPGMLKREYGEIESDILIVLKRAGLFQTRN